MFEVSECLGLVGFDPRQALCWVEELRSVEPIHESVVRIGSPWERMSDFDESERQIMRLQATNERHVGILIEWQDDHAFDGTTTQHWTINKRERSKQRNGINHSIGIVRNGINVTCNVDCIDVVVALQSLKVNSKGNRKPSCYVFVDLYAQTAILVVCARRRPKGRVARRFSTPWQQSTIESDQQSRVQRYRARSCKRKLLEELRVMLWW